MFTKGQSCELAWVTSSNIPSPLKWFLGPFSDFASSLVHIVQVLMINAFFHSQCIMTLLSRRFCGIYNNCKLYTCI